MRRILIIMILSLLLITNFSFPIKGQEIFIDASGVVLMEKESKRVLYAHNQNQRFLTASIAKIMTAIIIIEQSELDEYVTVQKDTVRQEGSSIYLQEGDSLKRIDLLYGMMLRSGNDAAYLLAKSVTGNVLDFTEMMNEKAKELGMTSSTFANPTGLDDESKNYSTAYDMAVLMAYCLDNEVFSKIVCTKSYTAISKNEKTYHFINKHKLVQSGGYFTGGKTGYTERAKRTLVTSAKKNGMTLIAVTFVCGDDWNAHTKMFEYGFSNYQIKTVMKRQIIEVDEAFYQITPYLPHAIRYPLKEHEVADVVIYLLNNPQNEKIIGKAVLKINNKEVMSVDIYRYY